MCSSDLKIKKTNDPAEGRTMELVRTEDILAGVVSRRADGNLPNLSTIVGFAAEYGRSTRRSPARNVSSPHFRQDPTIDANSAAALT